MLFLDFPKVAPWGLPLALALLFAQSTAQAEALTIEPALGLDIPTEIGKYYQLQQSDDLESESWTDVGQPIEGTGAEVEKLFSFKEDDSVFYRVVELKNQWVQVWADEFDGDSIDLTKWGKEENNYGGGNNEAQHYSVLEKYAYVENGKLHIAVYRDPYTTVDGKTQPYSSARLRTLQRGDWKYGRFEVRAKVPGGEGIWPAIWMLPSEPAYGIWAASGEIDILESKGTLIDRTYGTIHYGGSWPDNTYTGTEYFLPEGNFADGFHTYAIEWYEDRIEWYVNGVKYQTLTKDQWFSAAAPDSDTAPFDQKFHLIINVAVNGGFFNGTNQDANNLPDTAFPQVLEVDYIRVSKWAE
ncbi:glycoside hydrolase family 16 protein [Rubellicoccus peritrichatus]|uniref:Glycoside hydrolase family 16 protein n=1 Tax=Rubellicoccus peritrichatus TaxID=3080537 RepID=A0AAQ3LBR1_9BACT|nr:glycoside hydrolase family 16 protein [Puniceicoccus sp. CR14]WOO42831.1 glycoside hydrolase family 16 protein [Puniceicoccus sp. CR14]